MKHVAMALCVFAAAALCAPGASNAQFLSPGTGVVIKTSPPISVPPNEPLRVGFFVAQLGETYTRAMIDEAEKVARDHGFEIEVVNADLSVAKQRMQLRDALASKRFNAWYVVPLDTYRLCDILQKDAPAAGIPVVVSNTSLCTLGGGHFAEFASANVLAYVGASDTDWFMYEWLERVVDMEGGRAKVLLLNGFPGLMATTIVEEVTYELSARGDIEVVGQAYGDYTSAYAYLQTKSLLRSHPDVEAVLSVSADMTPGIVQALEEAGRLGDIAVHELGASERTLPLVDSAAVLSPRGYVRTALQVIMEAWRGLRVDLHWHASLIGGPTADGWEPCVFPHQCDGGFDPEY